MNQQKGLTTLEIIVIIVLVIVIVGFIIFYFFGKSTIKETSPIIVPSIITSNQSSTTATSATSSATPITPTATQNNWKTYFNDNFKYSFSYPNSWYATDRCYDKALDKWKEYDPKQWLVIVSITMGDKFPMCQSDFPQTDLIVRASAEPVDINTMMEQSDTDIESEEKINGVTWAKQIYTQPSEYDGTYATYYYINHNGKGYTISISNTDNKGTHNSQVDEIIKTFKFN